MGKRKKGLEASEQNEKLWNSDALSEERAKYIKTLEQLYAEDYPVNTLPAASGIFHQEVPAPLLNFQYSGDEHIVAQNKPQSAAIVLAKDRPSTLLSGYGRDGAMRANTIDMVVGRLSSAAGGFGPEDGAPADNDFITDAARIYISEMTDIDLNFGLSANEHALTGPASARSGIGIKADHVRVIGREGIKIVTGKAKGGFKGLGPHGELNSRGASIMQPNPPIELNAGNVSGTRNVRGNTFVSPSKIDLLQPVAMGKNVKDGLNELSLLIDEILGTMFNMTLALNTVFGVLAITPIAPHAAACSALLTYLVTNTQPSLHHTRASLNVWNVNYLEHPGYKYVCSRNVWTS
jgi:hypothetical protein